MLSSRLGLLDEREEVTLTFTEALLDSLDWVLRELLILHNEVMQVISQVVCAGRAAMAVEDSKEADLWPFDVEVYLVLGLQDVQNDGHAVLIVVANDTLVRVCSIRLDDAALLLTCLGRLVILQLDSLGIQRRRVLTEEERLHFDELNICVTLLLA